MQKSLQITIHGTEASPALDTFMRKKAAKLQQLHPDIISCHITVDKPQHNKRHGSAYDVRLAIHMPGKGEIVVSRQHEVDVFVAARDAFTAAKRQMETRTDALHGDVKAHKAHAQGHVEQLFAKDGYGFIVTPDGRSVYFARENVVEPPFDHLKVGTEVRFLEEAAGEGPQAKHVTAGKHHFL